MVTVPGLLSERIPGREKVISIFADEIRVHLFAGSAAIIGAEVFLLANKDLTEFPRVPFVLAFLAFFCIFAVLSYIFGLFMGETTAAVLALLPAAVFWYFLRRAEAWPFLPAAVLTAAGMRAVFIFLPKKEKVLLFASFVLDAAAIYLCLGEHVLEGKYFTDKLLFVSLAVLTLAALQKILYEWGKEAFPFYFFALAGLVVLSLPMGRKPIDWTPVIEAGENLVDTVLNAADSVSYYFSSFFPGDSYEAGYSAFDVTGENIGGGDETEIILSTRENPFYVYKDEETGKTMRVRRTVYLAGGRGVERAQVVRFLHFLHENDVDRGYAALFSKMSSLDVTYAYLDTADEIAPANSILLKSENEKIEGGVASRRHKKGYELSARYLEIDYGSPYLTELFNEGKSGGAMLSYEEISEYAQKLYSVRFADVMGREEYEEALSEAFSEEEAQAGEVTARLAELAETITEGASSDYEKCLRIEAYLRQYGYEKNAAGGHDPKSDMSTAAGMADIADRFLFETQSGYCVHYTSAMVTLLRLSGVPARAAVGYRFAFPFEKEESYEVSGSLAHAWPEAYLPGAGWVPFEPTTAYRTAAEFSWHRTIVGSEAGGVSAGNAVPEVPEAEEPAEELEEESGETAAQVFGIMWPVVLSIIGLLAAVIAGAVFARRMRYKHASPEKRIKMDVEMIKRSIRKLNEEPFEDRGLLSDYAARVPEACKKDAERVFDVYYRIVYGNGDPKVTPAENELARSLRERLVHGGAVDEK